MTRKQVAAILGCSHATADRWIPPVTRKSGYPAGRPRAHVAPTAPPDSSASPAEIRSHERRAREAAKRAQLLAEMSNTKVLPSVAGQDHG